MWVAICKPTIMRDKTSIKKREVHAAFPGPQIRQIANP